MASIDTDPRVIIQTDIDFFYGQVEELENPALKTQPFGVQQKHIIVTSNYLARKQGVQKLQLLTDALKTCPDLAIVNGEDLARYRAASKNIFHLVRSLVWGQQVERLGLDELFMDVTDMVEAHLKELGWTGDDGETVVLEKEQKFHVQTGMTFVYDPYTWVGFKVDSDGDRMSQTESQVQISYRTVKLHSASHLAAYIRGQILDRLGFTCSAGIASSKLLAKLAADAHKPNQQTLLCPDMHTAFILPLQIRKIMGIGYKAGRVLCEKLGLMNNEPAADEVEDGPSEGDPEGSGDWHLPQLTVSYVQNNCTIAQFIDWFGNRQGRQLWDLIHGIDTADVVPTPLIPSQISIEDSFRKCTSVDEATTKLRELAIDFIKRLEVELVVDDRWVKYPTTLRLTTRSRTGKNTRAWRDTRISKSKRMPVEVFDMEKTIEMRAHALVEQSLLSMLKHLVKDPFELTLLNIAAAHLSVKRPATSIQGLFAKGMNAIETSPRRPDSIDESTWSDLPVDIQRELSHYHHAATDEPLEPEATAPPADPPIESSIAKSLKRKHSEEELSRADSSNTFPENDTLDNVEFTPSVFESTQVFDDEDDNMGICHVCGRAMFSWAMAAHLLYHAKGAA